MANPLELKITRYINGDSITDTLNGSAVTLKHTYNPKPGDGETDISETVQLVLEGAQATVQSTVNTINRYLADARARNLNGYGDRVYIEARAGTAAGWRRSEITDGRISVTDDGMQAGLTSNARTNANLTITRRGWWENTAGTYLPIYNSNGTADASGEYVNVYNCNDGSGSSPNKRENWVKAASANIIGDLPAPIKTTVYSVTVTALNKVYAARTISHYPNLSADDYFFDQSGTSDAGCSGGAYLSTSISTDAETTVGTATIVKTVEEPYLVSKYGNAPFHVIARFKDNTSLANVRFRLKVQINSTTMWTGPQFMLSTSEIIQDMGVVNIPPGPAFEWNTLTLLLTATRITSATETIKLDYLALFGSELTVLQNIYTEPTGIYRFGGETNIATFAMLTPGEYSAPIIKYGANSLMVVPGRDNFYNFATQSSAAGTAAITHNCKINMSYRPRWSSPL